MAYRLSALAERDLEEIYYRHADDVVVARVLHGRRDQTAAWSEPDVS